MSKRNIILTAVLAVVLLSFGGAAAQDGTMVIKPLTKDDMRPPTPRSPGAHALVVAHERNAIAFAQILIDMAATGQIADAELARSAVAEIKRSVGKMDEIRQAHMGSMAKSDPAQLAKMKPMIDQMGADSAALNAHVRSLETALGSGTPNAPDIEAHAAALLMRLQKMSEPEKKMDMPGMKMGSDDKMDHHAMVMANGARAMGFSQTATTHHFLLAADGGAIQVEANDAADTANRDMVRAHLMQIAKQFKNGDFATPFAVHNRVPPGVPAMQAAKDKITYTYEETMRGARVRIATSDPAALAAIREFLKFQIEDHQTGDPVN